MGKVIILLSIVLLAGCQTNTGSFCSIASPVSFHERAISAMSDEEVNAALAHNEKGAALCGWKPSARPK